MLEVLNLTKIYKTKVGSNVKALDGVSLQFPETGMVFLLGKSGSGKSTLLNVCGGLDSPTSGEIIVKGRSSKKFSQSDFDSYRNTYVGFIFQEYNILNEFTVEENIALALELQGKSADKKVIAKLLEDVDLEGFARRKPNTLSGGQKQRIAIARALVKSPEIIMADEPTGALDSVTGKQVLDTLKKLSKDKLVLVVSHDREFAEQYADRIIELKDGKVICDVTKTKEQKKTLTDHIQVIGDVLCVTNAASLSEQEFDEIKTFLKKVNRDVIIAGNERDVKAFKAVSRISESGEKEVFKETDENKIEKKTYLPGESKFIRSKLPLRHASKIGVSSMGNKPVRLCFTILLCTVAFILFGLLSTMSFYDSKATYMETISDSNLTVVQLNKEYSAQEQWYSYGELQGSFPIDMEGKFSEAEILKYEKVFESEIFGAVTSFSNLNMMSTRSIYWSGEISTFGYLPTKHTLRQKIKGTYPDKVDEICISSYSAEVLYQCKTYDEQGKVSDLKSPEDILGKKILIDHQWYTVTGIFDSGKLPEKFNVLKKEDSEMDMILVNEFRNVLSDGLYLTIFVSDEKIKELTEDTRSFFDGSEYIRALLVDAKDSKEETYVFPNEINALYESLRKVNLEKEIVWFDAGETKVDDTQVVLDDVMFYQIVSEIYRDKNLIATQEIVEICNILTENGYKDKEREDKINQILERMKQDNITVTLGVQMYNESNNSIVGTVREFTVVGIRLGAEERFGNPQIFLTDHAFSEMWKVHSAEVEFYSECVTNYVEDPEAKYQCLMVSYDGTEQHKQQIWNIYQTDEFDEQGTRVTVSSSLLNTLEIVDTVVKIWSNVFLYAGIVLAIFAMLLFSNFISVSISYKKKEIGILRAVGARSVDVFKIFFAESFVIAFICVIAASLGSYMLCKLLNQLVASEFGASLFVFGPISLVVLTGIAMITAVLATFVPVWGAARKKPVESIRAI